MFRSCFPSINRLLPNWGISLRAPSPVAGQIKFATAVAAPPANKQILPNPPSIKKLMAEINKLPSHTPPQSYLESAVQSIDQQLRSQPHNQQVLFDQLEAAIKKWTGSGLELTPKLNSALIKLSSHNPYRIITWISDPRSWGGISPVDESEFELILKNLFLYTLRTGFFRTTELRGRPCYVDQAALGVLGLMRVYGCHEATGSVDYVVLICMLASHRTKTTNLEHVVSLLKPGSQTVDLVAKIHRDLHLLCGINSRVKPSSTVELMSAATHFDQLVIQDNALAITKDLKNVDPKFIFKPILKKIHSILFSGPVKEKEAASLTNHEMFRLYFMFHQILARVQLRSQLVILKK